MKLKYLVGIVIVVVGSVYVVYRLLKKMDNNKTRDESEDNYCNEDETTSTLDVMEQENDVTRQEEKCDSTMNQVYFNMSERNKMANKVLIDIHDDMKKSEGNIIKKKADIEKLMENLKK